jgi:hypothetical protein
MSRKRYAYVLFAVFAVALFASFFAAGISVWVPAVAAIATLAAGWGLALIAPRRFGRWPIVYMAVASPMVAVMAVYSTQIVARTNQ